MPRQSRVVAVGYPHHITQRGNNRDVVFFDDEDRWFYLDRIRHYALKYRLDIWAYCLMANHVHLLAVPHQSDALAKGVGLTNLTYTQHINRKYQRSGRIWQNRFFSAIVGTDHYLWAVARYIENNPVTAGLTAKAEDYEWSSAPYHLQGKSDSLMKCSGWLSPGDQNEYRLFLRQHDKQMNILIGQATRGGRPICSDEKLASLEKDFGRSF